MVVYFGNISTLMLQILASGHSHGGLLFRLLTYDVMCIAVTCPDVFVASLTY